MSIKQERLFLEPVKEPKIEAILRLLKEIPIQEQMKAYYLLQGMALACDIKGTNQTVN